MPDNEIPGMDGLCWSDLPLTEDEIEDLKMSGVFDGPDVKRAPAYGRCTGCGSVEVRLNKVHGYTAIQGESDRYPVGYGCEVCD